MNDEFDISIGPRFEEVARKMPDSIALIDGKNHITFGQLLAASDASKAICKPLKTNFPLALVGAHSVDTIVSLLGILRAGIPILPIEPRSAPAHLSKNLNNCQGVLTSPEHVSWLREQGVSVPILTSCGKTHLTGTTDAEPGLNAALPPNTCFIFLTSGSTGSPKGVIRSNRSVYFRKLHIEEEYDVDTDDRFALVSSIAYAGACGVLIGALLCGSTTVILNMRKSGGAGYVEAVRRSKITVPTFSPSLVRDAIPNVTPDPDGWQPRVVFFIGEAIRADDLFAFRKSTGWHGQFVIRLASSETEGVCEWDVDFNLLKPGGGVFLGEPVGGRLLDLVDENAQLIDAEGIGEIVLTGDFLASGYWMDKPLTDRSFVPVEYEGSPYIQQFSTGDLAERLPNGMIEYVGRKDNIVKIRSYRVNTDIVDNALRNLPGISDAATVGVPDTFGNTRLISYVQGPVVDREWNIRRALQGELPDYMIPRKIFFIEKLPRSESNKVAKNEMPKPSIARPDFLPEARKLDGNIQNRLAEIWTEILEIAPIGQNDNFFELGGDSLDLVKLSMGIGRTFDAKISESSLVDVEDLAEMAAIISAKIQ